MTKLNIGTAGWNIPRQYAEHFPEDGTALERYSSRFPVAEINSSFHRPHRRSTWERWRDSVPDGFRFSVKLPKEITHKRKLVDCAGGLEEFVDQASALGEKLGVLLVQLPPKLAFDRQLAGAFFKQLGARSSARVACEPRHESWFSSEADDLLDGLGIARVAADPAICPDAASPGGRRSLCYWRLHGSPLMYRSSYADRIPALAEKLTQEASKGRQVWCIFDNTASSAAAGDALAMTEEVGVD